MRIWPSGAPRLQPAPAAAVQAAASATASRRTGVIVVNPPLGPRAARTHALRPYAAVYPMSGPVQTLSVTAARARDRPASQPLGAAVNASHAEGGRGGVRSDRGEVGGRPAPPDRRLPARGRLPARARRGGGVAARVAPRPLARPYEPRPLRR